jgi:hypothetical protein
MKAYATDKTAEEAAIKSRPPVTRARTRTTRRSIKIESAIDILTQLLGSKEEVFAVLTEILVSDCELPEEQRRELFEELKKMEKLDG